MLIKSLSKNATVLWPSKTIQNKVEPALFLSIFSREMSSLVFLLMRSGTFSSDRSTPLHRTPALQYTVICHKPNVWFWKMHGFLYISSHWSFRVFASSPTYQSNQTGQAYPLKIRGIFNQRLNLQPLEGTRLISQPSNLTKKAYPA